MTLPSTLLLCRIKRTSPADTSSYPGDLSQRRRSRCGNRMTVPDAAAVQFSDVSGASLLQRSAILAAVPYSHGKKRIGNARGRSHFSRPLRPVELVALAHRVPTIGLKARAYALDFFT